MSRVTGTTVNTTEYVTNGQVRKTADNTTVFQNTGNVGAPVDTANTNGAHHNDKKLAEANKRALENALKPLFIKYGVDVNALKAEMTELVGFIQPKTPQQPITNEAVNKLAQYLELLFKTLKEQGKEINILNLREAHNNLVEQKINKLFSIDKDEYTLEDIEQNGLKPELCRLLGCTIEELNSQPEAQIKAAIKYLQMAYQDCQNPEDKSGLNIYSRACTYMRINDETKVDEFRTKLANGEIKGFRQKAGLKEGQPLTKDLVKNLVKSQMAGFKAQLSSIKDEKEKFEFINQCEAKQKQDFIETLGATNIEDRKAVFGAIGELFAEIRDDVIVEFFQLLPAEKRYEYAQNIKNEELKEILLNLDSVTGKSTPPESITVVTQLFTAHQSAELIETNTLESTNRIVELQQKKENGTITEAESRELEYELRNQAGINLGVAGHTYLDKTQKDILLRYANTLAYRNNFSREVLAKINEYVKNHPETEAEFEKAINEATNGNYDRVKNDIENGTETELVAPNTSGAVATSSSTTAAASNGIGLKNSKSVDTTKLEAITAEIMNQQMQPQTQKPEVATNEKTTKEKHSLNIDKDVIKLTREGWKEVAESIKEGGYDTLKKLYENLDRITNGGVANNLIKIYERLTDYQQGDVLKNCGNSALNELLPHTSTKTLKELEGKKLSSTYATDKLNNKLEEIEKRERNTQAC